MTAGGTPRVREHRLDERDVHVVFLGVAHDQRLLAYARRKIAAATRSASHPIRFARLTLASEPDGAIADRARATVLLDLDGRGVVAHAFGRTTREAIDRLEQRLRRRLGRDRSEMRERGGRIR
jgi:hypothetical protein